MNNIISKLNSCKIKLTNRFNLKDSDLFIASYPRSGNTWLRHLISDVILQKNNYETDTVLPIHADEIIPDIHVNDLTKFNETLQVPTRLIKTHHKYNRIKKHKIIFLFRNPADTLCSYFHFHRRYINLANKTKGGIDKFCIKYTDDWLSFVYSYIDKSDHDKILFVSYEKLHRESLDSLKKIFLFYGLDVDDEIILKSIKNHEFSKKKRIEKISEDHNNEFFFRKGKIASSNEELKPDTIFFIEQKTDTIYQKAIYLEEHSTFMNR